MAVNSGDPWFHLMVGQWWTPESDLGTLTIAASKRQATSSAWQNFSDELRQQLTGSLNPELQKGATADSVRDLFSWGADQAGDVAKTNGVISKSHGSAHRCAGELNSQLRTIADEGKNEIDQIQQSKDLPPIKLGKIVEVVMQCQQSANSAAAPATQNIFEAVQQILDQRGIHVSARQFAQQLGIDTTRMMGSSSKESITEQVKGILGEGDAPATPPPGDAPRTFGSRTAEPNPGSVAPPPESQRTFGPESQGQQPVATPAALGANTFGGRSEGVVISTSTTNAGSAGRGPSAIGAPPGISNALSTSAPTSIAPSNSLSQAGLAGMQPTNAGPPGLNALSQGAPTSGALNNMPSMAGPVQPQAPVQPTVSDFSAPSAPTAAHAPAFDAPAQTAPAAPPPTISHTSVTDSGTTYLAGPAAASAPAAPIAPAGSLPTYGSDIRPTAPTISAPTIPSSPSAIPSVSSAASPASAPVSPSAGAGSIAQPVVRQPNVTAISHPAPAGIGEQAVAVTAGGAAAGAASAAATATARLQRLVDFVASQEPRLRWAAGEQADGTTFLVTDIASGWIPPDIAIPSVVTLLAPGERRGNLETLLGEVSASASYTPLHYLPESPNGEPIPASPRPRQVPAVDELGWELSQATNWRDGLPQMAHTLAKAASSGYGVEGNEVEFLHQHLAMLRDKVLDSYPDDVDGATVANWQLLASINSLAAADGIGANYHFAWFQALNRVP